MKGSAIKDKLFRLLLMNDSASTSGSTCTSIDVSDSQNPFSSPPSTKQTQVPTTLIWYFFSLICRPLIWQIPPSAFGLSSTGSSLNPWVMWPTLPTFLWVIMTLRLTPYWVRSQTCSSSAFPEFQIGGPEPCCKFSNSAVSK